MKTSISIWATALLHLAASVSAAGVTGKAFGFATGTTGGGSATPVTPTTNDELIKYLTGDEPRVILIDRTFDFTLSEGTATETGCIPDSNTCGEHGQNALDGPNWCSSSYPSVEVTYNVAATDPIYVGSNKSLVGVGSKGVIRGRGLKLTSVENVIIQNIHITDLNPQYIWGGDAITLGNTDKIWIDHCKISLVGRQMIVTGFDPAGHVTISHTEFDGITDWSSSCNGDHYWTMLFLGKEDYITLADNYVHDCSGRAPKVGGSGAVTMHAVNNFFWNNLGHDFDVAEGGSVLVENNSFNNVTTPMTEASSTEGGKVFTVVSGGEKCASSLGRNCGANTLVESGDWPSLGDTSMLQTIGDAGYG
ncbi:hypothetical protein MW887_011674 [Aspergillus wentii]|nr:hypothetical protein MW887_011674 [Aspergillus wentii]